MSIAHGTSSDISVTRRVARAAVSMGYSISDSILSVAFVGMLTKFRFRIDAITLFAVPAEGPHGFHALGR